MTKERARDRQPGGARTVSASSLLWFSAGSECGKTVTNRCAGPRATRGPQMFKVLVCSHKRELAPWGGLTALTAEPASLPTGSVASRQLLPARNPLFALAPRAKAPFCGAPQP